jgi:hemerythrin superfamily protein
MSPDAVTAITNDHRQLETLFERLKADKGDRRTLVDEVAARLAAHARAEETEVYPVLTQADRTEEAEVGHAHEEHLDAEHRLRKVRNLVDSPHFDTALTEFVAAVQHHVEEEEHEILPALRAAVDEASLRRLGEAFERARAEHLKAAGVADGGRGGGGDGDGDLAEATRDELYEMAREADIPGRSGMKKDELREAVREQA